MNLDISKFNKKEEYADGKYSVYSFSGENRNFRRIVCSDESICILPFDLTDKNNIRNIYLSKYKDYLSDKFDHTCLTDTFNKDEFDSYYEAIESCLNNEMGLQNIDVNDTYYLGKIKHSLPFSKEYRCYGVNLTKYCNDMSGYTNPVQPSDPKMIIEKIKFNKLIKGDISDSLSLSCALLLLSYFSE